MSFGTFITQLPPNGNTCKCISRSMEGQIRPESIRYNVVNTGIEVMATLDLVCPKCEKSSIPGNVFIYSSMETIDAPWAGHTGPGHEIKTALLGTSHVPGAAYDLVFDTRLTCTCGQLDVGVHVNDMYSAKPNHGGSRQTCRCKGQVKKLTPVEGSMYSGGWSEGYAFRIALDNKCLACGLPTNEAPIRMYSMFTGPCRPWVAHMGDGHELRTKFSADVTGGDNPKIVVELDLKCSCEGLHNCSFILGSITNMNLTGGGETTGTTGSRAVGVLWN